MPKTFGRFSVIPFYSTKGEAPWMANTFRGLPVTIRGVKYPTTEHYFQAMKFPDNEQYRKMILGYKGSYSTFPEFARKCAQKLKLKLDTKEWDQRSLDIMREAVIAKVYQHPKIYNQLKEIDPNTIIVEATGEDKRWADGNDGRGQNLLGQIWMEARQIVAGRTPTLARQIAKDRYAEFDQYRKQFMLGRSLYEANVDDLHEKFQKKIMTLNKEILDLREKLSTNKRQAILVMKDNMTLQAKEQKLSALVQLKRQLVKKPHATEAEMRDFIGDLKQRYPMVTKGVLRNETSDLFKAVLQFAKRSDELRYTYTPISNPTLVSVRGVPISQSEYDEEIAWTPADTARQELSIKSPAAKSNLFAKMNTFFSSNGAAKTNQTKEFIYKFIEKNKSMLPAVYSVDAIKGLVTKLDNDQLKAVQSDIKKLGKQMDDKHMGKVDIKRSFAQIIDKITFTAKTDSSYKPHR